MNWLKKLWNWIIRKTATSPELTVVEEIEEIDDEAETETATEIFVRILLGRGVNIREIDVTKMDKLFEKWYDGPATEESVLASISDFKKQHGISFSNEG
tara:strand:- start:164 stop:460 length:297 start_codon:yes stop_codon:yes gene_type:complete